MTYQESLEEVKATLPEEQKELIKIDTALYIKAVIINCEKKIHGNTLNLIKRKLHRAETKEDYKKVEEFIESRIK